MANRFGSGRVIKCYSFGGRFYAARRRRIYLSWIVRFELLKMAHNVQGESK